MHKETTATYFMTAITVFEKNLEKFPFQMEESSGIPSGINVLKLLSSLFKYAGVFGPFKSSQPCVQGER
jgi:hypothetical protein